MRELRKDAAFVARENLRVKKDKDAAYEKKYRRLVAEIQGTEGPGGQRVRTRGEGGKAEEEQQVVDSGRWGWWLRCSFVV